MLNNKNPYEEKSVYHGQCQGQANGNIFQEEHGDPYSEKRQKGVEDLDSGFAWIGQLVGFDDGRELLQNSRVERQWLHVCEKCKYSKNKSRHVMSGLSGKDVQKSGFYTNLHPPVR